MASSNNLDALLADGELPFGHPGRRFDDTPEGFEPSPLVDQGPERDYTPDEDGRVVHYGPGERPLCGNDSMTAVYTDDRALVSGCRECLELVAEEPGDDNEYMGHCLHCRREITAQGGMEWRRVVRASCPHCGEPGWSQRQRANHTPNNDWMASVNEWEIDNEAIQSKRQTPNIWESSDQGLAMELLGEQRFQVLVSTMNQPSLSDHGMSTTQMEAQSFTTRPGEMGLAYSFLGIRMAASSASSANMGITLHKDNKGAPGTRLFRLNTPPNYSHGLSEFRDYLAFAPQGSRLEAGHRYWVVFRNHNPDIFEIRLTDSRGEDNDSVPGVTMGDRRYIRPDGEAWQHTTRPMRMMIMGQELLPTAHEADWPDLPGSVWTATTTNGVVTEGTVSTGHLTAGLDRDHGLTGDYWYLDTQPGHDYRVEVKFGDNPDVSTGGAAGTDFYDRGEDHNFVSSCCESDNNREDGATFFHFTQAEKESDTDYMADVTAYDHYNGSLSHTYNGPYEITLTDITGTERMINDFYGGTTVSSDEVLNASATNKGSLAMRFQTGGHAAGYTLDRIRVRSHDIANLGAVPEIAMHQDSSSSSSPGTKLCDIAVPDRIMEEPIRWISSLIHTYLAPDCADDVLASSNHYWIVFSGLDHVDYTLAYATSGAEDTDYFGSGWTIERTARKLASDIGWTSNTSHRLRVGFWAKPN